GRPLQVGLAHYDRRDRPEEWPQPSCPQRVRRWCADRHAAEPAVRSAEIYPEVEPARPAEATAFDQDSKRRQPERRHRAMAGSGGADPFRRAPPPELPRAEPAHTPHT